MKKFSYVVIFSLIIFLDQITKQLALLHLQWEHKSLLGFVNLGIVWNRGVSWGLFGRKAIGLGFYALAGLIALVIISFLVYAIVRYREKRGIFFETVVLAGALSNFFDRIYYGAVVDFVDVHAFGWHWPAFNVADVGIVVGIVGIIVRGWLCSPQKG